MVQGCRPITHRNPHRGDVLYTSGLTKDLSFPAILEPHFGSVAPKSRAWIDSFGILSGRQQRHFSTSALELLAAHAYPYSDREGCRTSCDYMNLTFILDDYSDNEGKRGTRVMSDSFMNALKDPTWDDGTSFAKLARE